MTNFKVGDRVGLNELYFMVYPEKRSRLKGVVGTVLSVDTRSIVVGVNFLPVEGCRWWSKRYIFKASQIVGKGLSKDIKL